MNIAKAIQLTLLFGLIILSNITCDAKQDTMPGVAVKKDSIGLAVRQYYPDYCILQLQNLSEDLRSYFRVTYHDTRPGYVQADFDCDGFSDYAVLLLLEITDKDKPLAKLSVLRGRENGTFIPIDLYEIGGEIVDSHFVKNCFIRVTPPGEVEEWNHSTKVVIKYPGIEWVNWESSSCVYYWRDGGFHHIWTSD